MMICFELVPSPLPHLSFFLLFSTLLFPPSKKKNKIGKNIPSFKTTKQTMSDNEGGADVDFNDDLFTCANVRLYIYIIYNI